MINYIIYLFLIYRFLHYLISTSSFNMKYKYLCPAFRLCRKAGLERPLGTGKALLSLSQGASLFSAPLTGRGKVSTALKKYFMPGLSAHQGEFWRNKNYFHIIHSLFSTVLTAG